MRPNVAINFSYLRYSPLNKFQDINLSIILPFPSSRSIFSGSQVFSLGKISQLYNKFKPKVDESKEFNNFQDNYWWPHRDYGYTGIVYFTEEGGTNLYSDETTDDKDNMIVNEHYAPWRTKSDYELLKTLEPKYNRFVFFDGLKFLHGMDISTNRYFNGERRKNQVYFFHTRVDDSTVYCV